MYTIYESIQRLCDDINIKPGKMCNDIGMSRSILTDLKTGRKKTISSETAKKIADYFGVSVDRVLGAEQKKPAPIAESELSDLQKQAIQFVMSLSDDQLRQFIRIGKALINEK